MQDGADSGVMRLQFCHAPAGQQIPGTLGCASAGTVVAISKKTIGVNSVCKFFFVSNPGDGLGFNSLRIIRPWRKLLPWQSKGATYGQLWKQAKGREP